MAPKSVPEDNTYPGDREPLWVTAAAARIDSVGVEFQRLRHRDGLSDEAPGANADQDDIDTPAAISHTDGRMELRSFKAPIVPNS